MPIARLESLNLNYLQLGSSSPISQDLLMVHGLATNLAFWYPCAHQFSSNYRVTLFDLRGHGRSSLAAKDYTPAQMAEDIKELIDFLEIKKVHLVGHSFGGSVGLHFACEYPERVASIILADVRLKLFQPEQMTCNWPNWPKLKPILEQVGIFIDETESESGYRLLTELARLRVKTPELEDSVLKILADLFPQGGGKRTAKQWLKLLDTTTAWQDFTKAETITGEQLQLLKQPKLAVYGEISPTLPTGEALRNIWSQGEFALIPQAGHFFPLSQPQKFVNLVENFLQSAS